MSMQHLKKPISDGFLNMGYTISYGSEYGSCRAPSNTFLLRCEYFVVDVRSKMSALPDPVDLASMPALRDKGWSTRRLQFGGYVSRLPQETSGWCDDEFYARNLWPCRDVNCTVVLGPMDGIAKEPKTVTEMYAEDERCCPVCGTTRSLISLSDALWSRVRIQRKGVMKVITSVARLQECQTFFACA